MQLAAVILLALGASLGAMALLQGARRTVDLASLRNIFFLSFVIFQLGSGATALFTEYWHQYPLSRPGTTAWIFTTACLGFTAIFLTAYHWGLGVRALAARLPGENASPSTTSLLVLAGAIVGTGAVFKLVLIYVPVFGPLSDIIGGALIALAAGLATWAWAPRLMNPVIAAYAGAIIVLAMGFSLVGTFGRRDLVAVLASGLWGFYHAWWKHGSFGFVIKRFSVAAAAGIVVVAAYTSVRSHQLKDAGIGAVARSMAGADVKGGVLDLAHGQFSGNISMWIIETRPDSFPYDTLHSARYLTTNIIPRKFYPDKPLGLGLIIPDQANLRNMSSGFNVGPGMIGHIFNDNPWIAFWLYPIFFGLLIRFADEAIATHYYSPFVILPIGAGLGEYIGLARGEIGLFTFNAILAIASAYFAMIAIRWLLHQFGWRPNFDTAPEDWPDADHPNSHTDTYSDTYTDTYTDTSTDDSRAA